MRDATRLPKAPPDVKGITTLRDDLIPILDVRCTSGLAETDQTAASGPKVVKVLRNLVRIVVDSVPSTGKAPSNKQPSVRFTTSDLTGEIA